MFVHVIVDSYVLLWFFVCLRVRRIARSCVCFRVWSDCACVCVCVGVCIRVDGYVCVFVVLLCCIELSV